MAQVRILQYVTALLEQQMQSLEYTVCEYAYLIVDTSIWLFRLSNKAQAAQEAFVSTKASTRPKMENHQTKRHTGRLCRHYIFVWHESLALNTALDIGTRRNSSNHNIVIWISILHHGDYTQPWHRCSGENSFTTPNRLHRKFAASSQRIVDQSDRRRE